jgi:hypothetical protein
MRLFAALCVALGVLCQAWCAQAAYSALKGDAPPLYAGGGLLYLSGNDSAGKGADATMPMVSVSGLTDFIGHGLSWQAFAATGSGTALGGSVDYTLSNSDDQPSPIPTPGQYWIGLGPALITYSGVFKDATGAHGVSRVDFGADLGFNYVWDKWLLQARAEYFLGEGDFALIGGLAYKF